MKKENPLWLGLWRHKGCWDKPVWLIRLASVPEPIKSDCRLSVHEKVLAHYLLENNAAGAFVQETLREQIRDNLYFIGMHANRILESLCSLRKNGYLVPTMKKRIVGQSYPYRFVIPACIRIEVEVKSGATAPKGSQKQKNK